LGFLYDHCAGYLNRRVTPRDGRVALGNKGVDGGVEIDTSFAQRRPEVTPCTISPVLNTPDVGADVISTVVLIGFPLR
jgi:hypothetical protein